jgi:hypothetical protein
MNRRKLYSYFLGVFVYLQIIINMKRIVIMYKKHRSYMSNFYLIIM